MYKIIFFIFSITLFNSCSFDNKTGIWTGSNKIAKKENNNDQNLELIFKKKNNDVITKELSKDVKLNLKTPNSYSIWGQQYQNNFNNIGNLLFLNDGNYKKLLKISKVDVNDNILIYKNNLFFSDTKGNIGVFSLADNQVIYKYNFYKKKIRAKKEIKLILKDDFIIAADNFGYVYSIDYKKKKLNWAKNFLVPFRSNLKILNDILFLSDEKNKIILIDTRSGSKIDELYTQPSKAVSKFESNIAIDKNNNLLFLSTNGSLYSLNLLNQKTINWIQNFKSENEIIFNANPIRISKDKIMISTNKNISLINDNGKRIWDLNIKSNIFPIISGNTIFTINEDNYLIFIDVVTGKIIFSKNLYSIMMQDFKKNFQKKIKKINHISLVNNKLLLISNNSYFIEVNLENIINISSIKKNPFVISSDIIYLENEMIFVSNSNRIYKVN